MQQGDFTKPTSTSGYVEAMSRMILAAGMGRRVLDAKWEGIRAAVGGFDAKKVAALTDADIERLMIDPRMPHDRRLLHAVIDNAAKILQVDAEHGGFHAYLHSQGSYEQAVAALERDFPFMTVVDAYYFLAIVGETAPDWERVRPYSTKPSTT